ncbi:MAG: LTA synthase family protein [Acholeplasmatales bacterium]|nr:MAG: LTA synthase family protein [Acholeplasmatales bacterium]
MQSTFSLAFSTLLFALFLRMILSKTIRIRFLRTGLVLDLLTLTGLFLLVALGIPSLWGQKVFYGLFVIFFSLLAIIDRVYHRYFFTLTTRTNAQGLTVFKGDANLTKEYNIRLGWQDGAVMVLGLVTLVWIMLQPHVDRVAIEERTMGWLLVIGIILIEVVIARWIRTSGRRKQTRLDYYQSAAYLHKTMYDRPAYAARFGYYYYHLVDLLQVKPKIKRQTAIERLDARFSNRPVHQANSESGLLKGSNVIHITVESLDTRFINEHITPTLHTMMQKGYTFPNTYIPVFQQGATCNGEFMATTGLYAINSNVHANNLCHKYRENKFPFSLPAQLKKAGYATYYFHSGHGWFYHRKTMMPNIGFETVKFQEDLKANGHKAFCERFDTQMIHFLDDFLKQDKPFYLQMLTYGMHGAYNQTDYQHQNHKIDKVYDETLDAELRVYLQKLAELDDFLTNIIERLNQAGLADKTLFVIAPDHYPYMLDQKTYTDHIGIDASSQALHKQTLMLYHADFKPKQFTKVGALVDVAPTVLNLIHPSGEFKYYDGQDMISPGKGVALLHDLSVCDATHRLHLNKVYQGDDSAREELEDALVRHIQNYETQSLLFETDYFRHMR